MLKIILLITPLKAFQKFCCLNDNGFCQIGGRMELVPVAVVGEFSDPVYGFLSPCIAPLFSIVHAAPLILQPRSDLLRDRAFVDAVCLGQPFVVGFL